MIAPLKSSKYGLLPLKGRRINGFTLSELIVSSALAALIGLFFAQSFRVISRFLSESDAKSSLKEAGDRITAQLNSDLASSITVFGRRRSAVTTYVDDYSSFVDLTGSPPIISGSRLRTVNAGTSGNSDGDVLFLAKELPPIDLLVGGQTRRIDRYVFIYYYVSLHADERPFGTTPARHLYRWRSIVYANSCQIANIPMGARPAYISSLKGKNIHFAFDPTQPFFSNAFNSLNADGTMSPLTNPKIQQEEILQVTKNKGARTVSGFSWGVNLNGFIVYGNQEYKNTDMRVALIAQGAFNGFIYYETFAYCNTRKGQ